MSTFSSGNFIGPYVGTDKVLQLKTSTGVLVGGLNVCQFVKASSEGKELWITTVLGIFYLDFNSPADAKVAQNNLNFALEQLLPNCQVGSSSSGSTYIHTQNIPATVWNINHNLNLFPSVTIVDITNTVIIGDVLYNDSNNITVIFTSATDGKAFLN